MPAPAGVCDTFRGDLPSDCSRGFGIRKTTLVVATESLSRRSLLSDLTILGIGPKRDFLNEALVPLKADLSHNADGGKVQCGNTSMDSKPLEPHELDRIATVTLAHYEQHAEEFRAGTRDHDVSQNIALLLILPPRRSG